MLSQKVREFSHPPPRRLKAQWRPVWCGRGFLPSFNAWKHKTWKRHHDLEVVERAFLVARANFFNGSVRWSWISSSARILDSVCFFGWLPSRMDGVFSTLWWRAISLTWALKESEAWLVFLKLPKKREWSRASSNREGGMWINQSFVHAHYNAKQREELLYNNELYASVRGRSKRAVPTKPSKSKHPLFRLTSVVGMGSLAEPRKSATRLVDERKGVHD